MERSFVGRADVFNRLRTWLGEDFDGRVRLISVEGPGGVGKTTLIEEALRAVDLRSRKFLDIRFRGEDFFLEGSGFLKDRIPLNPVEVLAGVANRARSQLPKDAQPYFALTLQLNDAFAAMKERVLREKKWRSLPEMARTYMEMLMTAGKLLGGVSVRFRTFFDATKADPATLDHIERFLEKLDEQFKSSGELGSALNPFHRKLRRNQDRLARDAWPVLAGDFYTDLVSILAGWRKEEAGKNIAKFLPRKVDGRDRLFMFFDDYESIENTFGVSFLVERLIPKLLDAPFQTVLLIAGRDELSATHPEWNRYFSNELYARTISLLPLTEENLVELITLRGLPGNPGEIARTLFAGTQGFPLLVDLALDEIAKGGKSAVTLMKFADRQTHWMNHTQRRWLEHLAFLDRVNLDTIQKVLPDEDAEEVFHWFQREGSIRDTAASVFTMRPFVRSRMLEYLEIKSPGGFQRLQKIAAAINGEGG